MSYGTHDEKSLIAVAEQFERFAADLRIGAAEIERHKLPPLQVTHQDALTRGMLLVTKFVGAVRLAVQSQASANGAFQAGAISTKAKKK